MTREQHVMTARIIHETDNVWDMKLVYRMVRERDHALSDRQRNLQSELIGLSKYLEQILTRINKLTECVEIVEKHGGDANSLRSQIEEAHAERQRIEPRHKYLESATTIIAANLRMINQAHDALHWLNFENQKLVEFDKEAEVPSVAYPYFQT